MTRRDDATRPVEAPCRTCGGPVDRRAGPRGGRPRLHCHGCRPVRRGAAEGRRDDTPCRTCGGPVDHSASRRGGRRRLRCHACHPPAVRRPAAPPRLADRVEGLAAASVLRAAFARAFQTAETAGWSTLSLQRVLAGLQLVVDGRPDADPIPVSELRVLLGATRGIRLARVAQVLDDLGLLVDDAVPTMRSWIEDRCAGAPGRVPHRGSGVAAGAARTATHAPGPGRPRRSTATSGGPGRTCWPGQPPVGNCARSPRTTSQPCWTSCAGTAWRAPSSRCSRCSASPSATA